MFRIHENEDPETVVGFVEARDRDSPDFAQHTYRLEADPYTPFVIDSQSGRISTTSVLDREQRTSYSMKVVAMDTSDPYYTSSASVTVSVLDRNDNKPLFTFPTIQNNTIHIGNNIPLGYIVAKVHAEDADDTDDDDDDDDDGGNDGVRGHKVSYELLRSSDDQSYFVLDRYTGVITVASSLHHLNNATFTLTLKASDNGVVAMSTTTTLFIIVDERYSLPLADNTDVSISNFVIVVIMTCVSGVIAVILVVAIFVICHKRFHDNRQDEYKHPVEEVKSLNERELSVTFDELAEKRVAGNDVKMTSCERLRRHAKQEQQQQKQQLIRSKVYKVRTLT